MVNVYITIFISNEREIVISIIALVSANDHKIVGGIYNYFFHYPFHNLFAHSKYLHSLLYLTS